MSPVWITAAQALDIIEEQSDGYAAKMAICTRAHSGLISAKARFLKTGTRSDENAAIPAAFWWARDYDALEQDWANGDFSTTLDRRTSCSALGVSFDFNGLREMLSPERAATVARSLSVAGNPGWVTSKAARNFMYTAFGADPIRAGSALLDQCRLGFVAARAVKMQRAATGTSDHWVEEVREWDVPLWYWEDFTGTGSSAQDWETGKFSGRGGRHGGWLTLSGVHFSRASLDAMLPETSIAATPAAAAAQSVGGRPPAAYWDDLWCAIWGQIYRGELVPKSQADVVTAMLEWASNKEYELGDTTAKARARRLFQEYQREGENL